MTGKEWSGTHIKFRLEGRGSGTLVRFTHSGWEAKTEYFVSCNTTYAQVGFDLGDLLTGTFNGQYASFTIDASTGDVIDAFFADAPMNGSTIELPAIASEIGLTQKAAKPTAFRYTVNAFSLVPGGIVDTTGSALFDPFHPAVSSGDFSPLAAGGGTASLPLSIDKSQQAKTPALGWLVASVDDANGAPQADEVAAPAVK